MGEQGNHSQEIDVLLVSLGSTPGLRRADAELGRSLRRAGARVAIAETPHPGDVRTLALTDLLWARAARRAAQEALARLRQPQPPAVIYSTTTAALLWPRPGAIRFDAPNAANRPGRHGLWQRPLERRRLHQAPLLLPWSEGGLAEACGAAPDCAGRALVLPAPIAIEPPGVLGAASEQDIECETDGQAGRSRDRGIAALTRDIAAISDRNIAAVTYAGNPRKKGFDRVLAAWRRVRRSGEQLVVVGISPAALAAAGFELPDADIHVAGPLAHAELRALMRRARVFLCAPRREDYGLIQLEALAEGCMLVTTPAPGPYAALAIAHALDPRLVSDDLAVALRAALDTPTNDYCSRAAALIAPFGQMACDGLVAERLLPQLLSR